jgi:hypothetical protein
LFCVQRERAFSISEKIVTKMFCLKNCFKVFSFLLILYFGVKFVIE